MMAAEGVDVFHIVYYGGNMETHSGPQANCPKCAEHDPVNHPKHYTSHPSGIECIDVTRHMNFNLGNAVKYIWRADLKKDALEDLKKAAWYIADEIKKREKKS